MIIMMIKVQKIFLSLHYSDWQCFDWSHSRISFLTDDHLLSQSSQMLLEEVKCLLPRHLLVFRLALWNAGSCNTSGSQSQPHA